MTYAASVTSKGQIVIPKSIRDRFGIGFATRVIFELREDGFVVRPAPTIKEMFGFIKASKKHSETDFDKAIAEGIAEDFRKHDNH